MWLRGLLWAALPLLWSSSVWAQVQGEVLLEGTASAPQRSSLVSDPNCPLPPPAAALRNGGSVPDALVVLADPPPGSHRSLDPVNFVFESCSLKPKAAGILVGQQLVVKNEGNTLHTIRLQGGVELVRSLPRKGRRFTHRFKQARGLVEMTDPVHPGVRASLVVVAHPYFAVTDADGRFTLGGPPLPDGSYRVRVWHPRLGESIRPLVVVDQKAEVKWRVSAAAGKPSGS